MKTTLNIDDTVMAQLRREAANSDRTMSEIVETALRQLLQQRSERVTLPPMPSLNSDGAFVDVSDGEALVNAMDNR